jgi:hypothetical protein
VQLHWPWSKQAYVSGAGWRCGPQPDRNFPVNGHVTLLLINHAKSPVSLDFSIEPFRAGIGYPKQSKTLTLNVSAKR